MITNNLGNIIVPVFGKIAADQSKTECSTVFAKEEKMISP